MKGEYAMQAKTVQLPSAALTYEKYGDGEVNLVIEMGLDTAMGEWRQLAMKEQQSLHSSDGFGSDLRVTLIGRRQCLKH